MAETKFYLTKKGLERIKQEHQSLLEFKKLKTKGEVPALWHSEEVNPDYLAFQEDMSLLEAKLAEQEYILKHAELIIPSKGAASQVALGVTVTLEETDGALNEYTLLGTLEANPSEGKISSESPVGRALLGKRTGEEVIISSPIRVVYRIKKIRYLNF